MNRPVDGDFGEFYRNYISLTKSKTSKDLVRDYSSEIKSFFEKLPTDSGDYAYDNGKWTIKQMIQHMLDTERIFVYRLIWIARNGEASLPGFDENQFANAAPAQHRLLSDLIDEYMYLRNSTDILIANLTTTELNQKGVASGFPISVNALCFIIFGHNLHHINVLKERYLK